MVDFEWYRSFIAVYRSGTVTGAAKARFLTQPAISQHISALEVSVGSSLFDRTPRKMIPTEQGKTLYNKMALAMDSLEKVSTHLKDNETVESPLIRLGVPLDYFYEVAFEKLISPQFRLHIETDDAQKIIDALSRGKLDAVISTQQVRADNIDYRKIGQEEFFLVSAPEITLPTLQEKALFQPSDMEKFLLQQKWVSYSVELPIIRRFWHIAFGRRPNIEPKMVAPNLSLIRKAVELGWGISVLPYYICQPSLDQGSLKILWQPKESVINDLWIATRKVDRNKSEIAQLISLMKNN
jgi:DNA-binding transcriptional LysR family regulator